MSQRNSGLLTSDCIDTESMGNIAVQSLTDPGGFKAHRIPLDEKARGGQSTTLEIRKIQGVIFKLHGKGFDWLMEILLMILYLPVRYYGWRRYPMGCARKHKKPPRAVRFSLNSAILAYIFFHFAGWDAACSIPRETSLWSLRFQTPAPDSVDLQIRKDCLESPVWIWLEVHVLLLFLACVRRRQFENPTWHSDREEVFVYAREQDRAEDLLGIPSKESTKTSYLSSCFLSLTNLVKYF